MKLRYSKRASRQIDVALDFLGVRSPQGAVVVQERILALETLLEAHPYAGRATSRPGVRRFALTPHPYFVDYRVDGEAIVVLRFRHSSRRPLP